MQAPKIQAPLVGEIMKILFFELQGRVIRT